ncbi:MAG: ThiF family adenylyltransferase [Nitrospira sp. SB0678_bin_10]|nr:ThiF family adenylyltransferase [Nitrospira sp. SB0678_bin_10]
MSHALIARNADLRRLEEEGYTLRIVDDGYLLIENVPYVTDRGEVHEGILVMELTLSGDRTVSPATHAAHWTGEFPYDASGNKLLVLIKEGARRGSLSGSIPPTFQLSAKPDGGYRDYHHKVTTYVEILAREARRISPASTAQQWRVIADQDDVESVFHFADTASARQNTTDLARKLQNEKIAIVGVGGTGSYVLDLVAKTWAREIHLFDDDRFLQHNAFRSPGPFSRDELEGGPIKSIFHAERYSRMRKMLIAHNTCIDETNVQQLGGFDTVFLCMDGHQIKAQILETCMAHGTLLIDVGMGLYRVNDSIAGVIRTTTCCPEHHHHAEDCIDLARDKAPGEYERNAQLAELNALNAALAVIQWKKMRGFYNDLTRELNCEYLIDGNKLINSFCRAATS